MLKRCSLALIGALCLCALPQAWAQTVIYTNDFESGQIGPEWSSNTYLDTHQQFSTFVGRYSQFEWVTLTIPASSIPPGGGESPVDMLVEFDLYAIDSWDGSELVHGIDLFTVKVNEVLFFSESIANTHSFQTFREPDIGRTQLGYGTWKDSIYLDVTVPFTHDRGADLVIKWQSRNLLSLADESWGIDNVRVSVTNVPAPGPIALLACATLTGLVRRRGPKF